MNTEEFTISCVIVEDEPLALQLMEKYVEQTDFLRLGGAFLSAVALKEKLDAGLHPDLIFSDIQMPQISGLELAQAVPEGCKIIFTTAYDQYALEGFKVNAIDYLVKPISYEDFLAAAQKGARLIINERLATAPQQAPAGNTISIKSEHKTYLLRTDEIQHIEGMKDFAKIYLADQSSVMTLIRLKSLFAMLPKDEFIFVHKSHIVRKGAVKSFNAHSVVVDETELPVGRHFSSEVVSTMKKLEK